MKTLNFVTACAFGALAVLCGIVAVVKQRREYAFLGTVCLIVGYAFWRDYKAMKGTDE